MTGANDGILNDTRELFPDVTLVRIYKGQDYGLHDGASGEASESEAEHRRSLARRRALERVQNPRESGAQVPPE